MIRSDLSVGLLAVVLALCGAACPALAQERVQLPSQRHSSAGATQDVALHTLPRVNTEALRQGDKAQTGQIGPYRYGTVVETDLRAHRDGTWESLPGGHWLWRLRVRSQDAVSLSVAFTDFRLPKGAALYVYGPDRAPVRGPYTHEDATANQHRAPLVTGETLTVELMVPRGRRSQTDVTIGRVVHGYRPLRRSPSTGTYSKAGDCNIDVACEEADPWRDQVRSVGLYSFESGGRAFACSGALVNSTAADKTPYFLTAEHCVSTPEEARSMVFFWNYQNPTCRPPGTDANGDVTDADPTDQTSTGARLRARYGNTHDQGQIGGKPDLSLVEIDDFVPPSYDLYLSGWSLADTPTKESVTIHHPQGHGKRISFDEDPSSITSYASSGDEETHLRIANWERGTTEGGSSGSPLFDEDQRIVGVLSGGRAGCTLEANGAEDNNAPDWYGRIRPGFSNGDFKGATLSDWLDPTNSGTRTLDGVDLLDSDDQTPPSRIDDITVSSVDTTSMTVSWTASGDDGKQGQAYYYDLRYATSRITSEADFAAARPVSVPFPGTSENEASQGAQVTGLVPDSTYYFAVRAIDDGGNRSPITETDGTFLPDRLAPASISDLSVTAVRTSELSVTLEWTAPGDDGNRGTVATYDLRYANEPILSTGDFKQASQVSAPVNPAEAGETQSVVVDESDGLESNQTYYFALRAKDNAGNVSPTATPRKTAVLTEDIKITRSTPVSSPTTEASFVVTETQQVRIALYDLLGRRVRNVFKERVSEGFERTVQYDVGDLSSGPYFLRFSGETFTKSRKIMVVN